MNSKLSSLILLLHIQGSLTLDDITVTCEEQNICAVRGDQVALWCDYSNINIKTGFWFNRKRRTNWRNKDEPEDLTLDSDYSGRVDQRINEDYSELTIYDLRERDSGEYQLMLIMKDGVKHLSSVTVNLTVTVPQVRINPELTGQQVKMTCETSCKLGFRIYEWYKNGKYFTRSTNVLVLSSRNTDRYSCSVYSNYIQNNQNSMGPSVCLSNSSCWDVTYTSAEVCALVGSTVDIHSTYSHPNGYTAEKTYWQYISSGEIYPWRDREVPAELLFDLQDLHDVQEFAGRVEHVGNTLRIKYVKMSDSGQYVIRITDMFGGKFTGFPGVFLTVTDTWVRRSPKHVIDGEKVILSCSTKCPLDSKHNYIWYKNGQQVTDGLTLLNKLYLDSINSEELKEYSCTVREMKDSSVFILLLVFLPQFLIIGALWLWFFISMNKLNSSRNKTDDKQIEISSH